MANNTGLIILIIAVILIAGVLGGNYLFGSIGRSCVGESDCNPPYDDGQCPVDVDHCYCYNSACYTCKPENEYCTEDNQCCSYGCVNNACEAEIPTICQDECEFFGKLDCKGNDKYACTRYIRDTDTCLEWSFVSACPSGTTCVEYSPTSLQCEGTEVTTTSVTTTTIYDDLIDTGDSCYSIGQGKCDGSRAYICDVDLIWKFWRDCKVVHSQKHECHVLLGGVRCCILDGIKLTEEEFKDYNEAVGCCSRKALQYAFKPEYSGVGIIVPDPQVFGISLIKVLVGPSYPAGKPIGWHRSYELLPGIPLVDDISGWSTEYYCGDEGTLPQEKKDFAESAVRVDPDTGIPFEGEYGEQPRIILPDLGLSKGLAQLGQEYCVAGYCFSLLVWFIFGAMILFILSFLRR